MALEFRNGSWYWRKMIDGVMFNRSTKTADKKLAETLTRKWEHEAVQSVVYDGERPINVHDAIKAFLEQRENTGGYGNACTHMTRWKAAIPNVPFSAVQKRQVQAAIRMMQTNGYAHNTITVAIMYWNALVNYCAENQLSAGPKADKIKPKQTRFRIITEQEEAAILAATCPNTKYPGKNTQTDAMRQDNQDVLVCLLHLGARINEAQNLRWSDIDFAANTVLVRRLKRSNDTLLLMTNALRVVMERRYKAKIDAWVFPSKSETYKTNAQWINTIVKRAGINLENGKITSHTFRHTAATRLLRAGMDITMVQKFLGHKQISSTMVYLHSQPSEVANKAIAVFDGK